MQQYIQKFKFENIPQETSKDILESLFLISAEKNELGSDAAQLYTFLKEK